MGRFQEITDEPVAAPSGVSRYQEVDAAPATKSLDPDDEVPDDARIAKILGRKLKNTGSYEDVMDQWRRDNRALSGETGPTLSGLITGEQQPKKPAAPVAGTFNKKQSAVMGFGQGATLGFADEALAGAGTVASKIPGMSTFMHYWTGLPQAVTEQAYDPNVTYEQRRDLTRNAFKRSQEDNPISYGAGEIAGTLATTPIIPGGAAAKGASIGQKVLMAGQGAAIAGFGQGLGNSEADLMKGEFGKAFQDAGKSALIGSVTGTALGGTLGYLGGKLASKAPALDAENLLSKVVAGDGSHGAATKTARMLVEKDAPDIVATLHADKELRSIIGKDAKVVEPKLHQRLDEVGSQLDPKYNAVDKATGGVSLLNLANTLDDEMAQLSKSPLNETYVKAVKDIKESILNAYAPDLAQRLAANAKSEAAGIESPFFKKLKDVMVPTRQIRAVVTRLQKRGTQVINPLNPGESSIMKSDMAKMMFNVIDAHLDRAAEIGGADVAKAVGEIRKINTTYSALSNMLKAVEQRGINESSGSTSMGGHVMKALKGAGLLTAGQQAMHGNFGGAAAALAAPAALHYGPALGRAFVGGMVGQSGAADTAMARMIVSLMQEGIPQATAIQLARANAPGHTFGAPVSSLPPPEPEPADAAATE